MESYKLCIQVIPMPCDTNANGDISGWYTSVIDYIFYQP